MLHSPPCVLGASFDACSVAVAETAGPFGLTAGSFGLLAGSFGLLAGSFGLLARSFDEATRSSGQTEQPCALTAGSPDQTAR
jgi:hypothetical protein